MSEQQVVLTNHAKPQERKPSTSFTMGAELHNTAVVLQAGQAISDGLNSLPEIPNTEIAGKGTFLPSFAHYAITSGVFLGSALNLKETWDSVKDLYYAENKNFDRVTKLAVNLFRSVTLGLFWASLITGAAYALPILLPVSAGVGAGWALYQAAKMGRKAYQAHTQQNSAERSRFLMNMLPHIFSAAINGLGVGATIILNGVGSALSKAHDMFVEGMKTFNLKEISAAISMTQASARIFSAVKPLAYTLGALFTVGGAVFFTHQALQHFQATKTALLNPMRSIRKLATAVSAKTSALGKMIKSTYGLGIIAAPVIVGLEIGSALISATASLAQLVLAAPIMLFSRLVKKKKELLPKPVEPQIEQSRHSLLQMEHAKIKTLLAKQAERLGPLAANKKQLAKLYIVQELDKKLGETVESYDDKTELNSIEASAKVISPLSKQSFFRSVGRTEGIVNLVKEFNEKVTQYKDVIARSA